MRIKFILVLFFFIICPVFSQKDIAFISDWYFVAERPEPGDMILPVLSIFLEVLVSDADTLSFITYSEKPLLVCPPLEGNTPDLSQLIISRLKAVPTAKATTENTLAAAIDLADEQAAVHARPEALSRLFIFGEAKTTAAGITPPKNFPGGVFYISLDAPLEQTIADLAGAGHFWHFGIEQPPAEKATAPGDAVNFADGFAALICAVNDRYAIGQKGGETFSAGSFFKTVKNILVLVENVQPGISLSVSKDGKVIPDVRSVQAERYGIIKLNNVPAGNYRVTGGSIIQVMEWTELSPLIFAVVCLGLAILLLLLVILLIAAVKNAEKQKRPVFKVICEVNNRNAGFPEPEICIKKNPKNLLQFESGAKIKDIVMIGMRGDIEKSKLSPIVKDDFPFIQFDKQRNLWVIKYNINKPVQEEEQDTSVDEGPDLFGRKKTPTVAEIDQTNTKTAEFDVDEEYIIPEHNVKFEVPGFFIDRSYRLFLTRQ